MEKPKKLTVLINTQQSNAQQVQNMYIVH